MILTVLNTARLILRGPSLQDRKPLEAFFASPRSQPYSGPLSAQEVHVALLATVGSWQMHGYGPWHIEERSSGAFVGWVGLVHVLDMPEPNFTWAILPEFQDNEYALEAITAARRHLATVMQRPTPAAFVLQSNTRALALLRKIGAEEEERLPLFSIPAVRMRLPAFEEVSA